jgi:hypothetical protein
MEFTEAPPEKEEEVDSPHSVGIFDRKLRVERKREQSPRENGEVSRGGGGIQECWEAKAAACWVRIKAATRS